MFDPIYPGLVLDPRDLRNAVRDPEPNEITVTVDWSSPPKGTLRFPKLRPDLLRRHIEATTLPSRRLPRVLPFLAGVAFGLLAGAVGLLLVATGG